VCEPSVSAQVRSAHGPDGGVQVIVVDTHNNCLCVSEVVDSIAHMSEPQCNGVS
jgi:hypothetical protein